ncbi:M24 family metallopeptidase [Schleiferilactobacillus shenzhenensis]|uniref:PepQ n=1 Tax=Schleiferilactobacillus shenzhenensis LY-73 TaxID=1231336 RepID=U4TML8_9LACO|nr:Xaa-Pro peptidase family protein [Schleiferilactobacillus shenzhenensis]ERL65454.1 PepQ [Schleiferilactobacillus shenzhenensis LY-73]
MSHLTQLQQWIADQGVDVAYISDPTDINYFTGFYSEPEERVLALFVFPDAAPFLFAPALSVEAAKKAGWTGDVFGYMDQEDPFTAIAARIKERSQNNRTWAIEKDVLPFGRYEAVRKFFPDAVFTADASRYMEQAKLIKSADEIALMVAAGKEADECFRVGFNALRTGITEQGVAAEIDYAMMQQGVMHMSFDTIVQAGINAADPHGEPSAAQVAPNELVLFDLGTNHQGYMSDASRTVAYGEPTAKQKEIFDVCLEAQLAAMDAVKPGLLASELDKIARDIIAQAGYGEYFIHRLGHGIGTSTHEFPSIMAGNDMPLQEGMCFSIEPGIYIPGVAGVRIEDCVHVTATGSEPFTHTDKALRVIPVRD